SGNLETEARSAEEYLILYLRSLDVAAAGLSPAFTDRLRRALRHYGIDDLRRSPELEESLLWIGKAHQRMGEQVGAVLRILERRLDPLAPGACGAVRAVRARSATWWNARSPSSRCSRRASRARRRWTAGRCSRC